MSSFKSKSEQREKTPNATSTSMFIQLMRNAADKGTLAEKLAAQQAISRACAQRAWSVGRAGARRGGCGGSLGIPQIGAHEEQV